MLYFIYLLGNDLVSFYHTKLTTLRINNKPDIHYMSQ